MTKKIDFISVIVFMLTFLFAGEARPQTAGEVRTFAGLNFVRCPENFDGSIEAFWLMATPMSIGSMKNVLDEEDNETVKQIINGIEVNHIKQILNGEQGDSYPVLGIRAEEVEKVIKKLRDTVINNDDGQIVTRVEIFRLPTRGELYHVARGGDEERIFAKGTWEPYRDWNDGAAAKDAFDARYDAHIKKGLDERASLDSEEVFATLIEHILDPAESGKPIQTGGKTGIEDREGVAKKMLQAAFGDWILKQFEGTVDPQKVAFIEHDDWRNNMESDNWHKNISAIHNNIAEWTSEGHLVGLPFNFPVRNHPNFSLLQLVEDKENFENSKGLELYAGFRLAMSETIELKPNWFSIIRRNSENTERLNQYERDLTDLPSGSDKIKYVQAYKGDFEELKRIDPLFFELLTELDTPH